MISIITIPQLKDNYSYAIMNKKEVIIIDPAESISIIKYINKNKLSLKAILITHHHSDHTSGIKGILNEKDVPVYSPNSNILNTTNIIKENESIDLKFINFDIISTPGHTGDHIVFYSKEKKILFSGDTLFRLGCGRVFEGSYRQMYTSLQKINALDNNTLVYCGHEYTNMNLKFLLSVFQNNKNLLSEKKKIINQLNKTKSSIPFKLENEKKINPFLSPESSNFTEFKNNHGYSNFELFSYLRDLKNNF